MNSGKRSSCALAATGESRLQALSRTRWPAISNEPQEPDESPADAKALDLRRVQSSARRTVVCARPRRTTLCFMVLSNTKLVIPEKPHYISSCLCILDYRRSVREHVIKFCTYLSLFIQTFRTLPALHSTPGCMPAILGAGELMLRRARRLRLGAQIAHVSAIEEPT